MSEQWIETCWCGASIKLTGWMVSHTEEVALEWRKNHHCKTHKSRRLAMTDQQPHTPTTAEIMDSYRRGRVWATPNGGRIYAAEFDRWLDTRDDKLITSAEQRGAKRAFRRTQEIIAGFDHTIDEARNRDDMINTGYLIQEIDTEIQDLMEDDDETH